MNDSNEISINMPSAPMPMPEGDAPALMHVRIVTSLTVRIQGLLPPLAYMVSRPRQPTTVGEELLRRFDAGVRPYWLRDWQSGFGGYTKVYEYQVDGETRRRFSVAHVVRPRIKTSNACLCFTLMSKMPDQKPWKRPRNTNPSTVMLHSNTIGLSLEDNMQVQCLPVFGSDRPKWTYRKVPKVIAFWNFGRLPPWCRRSQKMTYHLCAEEMSKTAIVPSLSEEDQDALLNHGILPQESSARDRFCVMCPVKRGSRHTLEGYVRVMCRS